MRRPITVWWGIPCKSVVPVFRALAEQHGRDVHFVSLHNLPERRKKLGWTMPPNGTMPLTVLPDENWRAAVDEIAASRQGLHIVNGIYHDARVRYVAYKLASEKRPFGIVMEAPANLEVGIRRLAKSILGPVVTPLRTWRVAKEAEFALSASGDRPRAFKALGFAPDRIFPFGYFPDFPLIDRATPADGPGLRLLCVGYLEPFKGQDCLLGALALLRGCGVPFKCTITGFGSAKERLVAMTAALGLEDRVTFPGVVSDKSLTELFRESNALVAPGLEEPWGIRVNEALLCGLPVVVSDGVGAKELVEISGAGEVFQAGLEHSLADALQRLWQRLQSDVDIWETARCFRSAILPSAAADFVEQIVRRGEARTDGAVERPVPLWRKPDWRQIAAAA